jgi:hypothetical protein
VQTTDRPGNVDVFGINRSLVLAQTFILSAALIKGNTAYRPPDVEYRITLAVQGNYVDVSERRVLFVEPTKGTSRLDTWIGVQEAFVDYHFRNVSYRYDFDSIRIGIQPLQFDFRGFLFNDSNLASACSATATTTASVQSDRRVAAGEGHQLRPQRHHREPAQRLDHPRQRVPAGPAGGRPHQRGEPHLEHQPRRPGHPHRR